MDTLPYNKGRQKIAVELLKEPKPRQSTRSGRDLKHIGLLTYQRIETIKYIVNRIGHYEDHPTDPL